MLLVHGFPDTAWTWDAVGPRLAVAGFRAVAPFTRGIAPTALPRDDDFRTDTQARDLLATLDALEAEQAVLVGHDFGASAVYAATGLAPARVRKLVAVAIPHPATLRPSPGKLWGARHFLTHRLPGAARRFARDDFAQVRVLYERWSPGFDWPEDELTAVKKAYAQPGVLRAALAYYRDLALRPTPGLSATIDVPTLILGGQSDGVATAADFEASQRMFTGPVDIQMLPGGHFLHREHPEPFIDALLADLG